jgi:hypothetical protein
MTANGIPQPTEPQKQKQNTLVVDLKAALGSWDRIKSLRVYAGTNQQAALLDWKRLIVMLALNNPIHTEAAGFKGDGVAASIECNFTAGNLPPQNNAGTVSVITANGTNSAFAAGAVTSIFIPGPTALARSYVYATVGLTLPGVASFPEVAGGIRLNPTEYQQVVYPGAFSPVTAPFSNQAIQRDLRGFSTFSSASIAVRMDCEAYTIAEFNAMAQAFLTYMTP